MKKVLIILVCCFLAGCALRTIQLQSENDTYHIPQHYKSLYVTSSKTGSIQSITDRKISNAIAHAFARKGW